MQHFDHIIVGTGQATSTLLGGLLPTGASIAVLEGDVIGGTCVNWGCTPTKALVASARVAHLARRAAEYGVEAASVSVDYARVRARMNRLRTESREGLTNYLTSSDQVTLLRKWATFTGPKQLRVGEEEITGDRIYLNVGARPRVPDLPGLETVDWLDSTRLLGLRDLPDHLIILGGGYIGLEFAQIYRRFGANVSVVQRADQLMPREDADVADAIAAILRDEGIRLHLGTDATQVRPSEGGGVTLTVARGERTDEITGSHLLVAVGRVPNSDRLGLEAAGIETDPRGFILVEEHLRTNVDGVFAVGDVNGHGAFTHTAVNDAEIVLDYLHGGDRCLSDRVTTYALFTDPPLGRVGLTEKAALEQGYAVMRATRPMAKISRAKEMGETKGFVKLLVDADTDLILGASILGVGGDEIVNMFTALIYSELPCRTYRKAMLIHPTVSELMPWVLDHLERVEA